jgi:hypothetical protein
MAVSSRPITQNQQNIIIMRNIRRRLAAMYTSTSASKRRLALWRGIFDARGMSVLKPEMPTILHDRARER